LKWIELAVDAPPEFVEPLTEIFHRYGHGGVATEQDAGHNPDEGERAPIPDYVTVRTYLPLDSTTHNRREQIDVGVRLVAYLADVSPLRERVIEEQDWQNAWKEHFYPLRIGRNIVICPTWREYRAGPSDQVILLDPGMAFGTGHHPTTRTCLEVLEDLVEPGSRVLDVGCGSAILSMTAVALGAASAFGLEIDPIATRAANDNVAVNRQESRVTIAHGTLPSSLAPERSFDIVVANISAKVVIDLAPQLLRAMADCGRLMASGIIQDHVDAVVSTIESHGGSIEDRFVDGDWVTLLASS
tara:strand:- start:10514 stop:11413 length:900 start_codon:yes stop_codon:yes gene_type:complete